MTSTSTGIPVALAALLLTAVPDGSSSARPLEPTPQAPAPAARPTGEHDFDFEVGEWRVHHRVKRPAEASTWLEFEGTCGARGLMDGRANVEEHVFDKPSGVSRGVGLRAYDPQTGEWAIWWIDGRAPHGALDPPVKGRFENGVGTFYSESLVDGRTVRTRFVWSHITPVSARWEQAHSTDAGQTWETNWIMEFQRIP